MFRVPLLTFHNRNNNMNTRKVPAHSTVFSSSSVKVLEALCTCTDIGKREFAAHKLVLSVWYGFFSGLFAKACRYDSRQAIFYPKNYATNGRSTN